MTRFGIDYEGGLTGAQVKASGASFVCRYLSDYPPKNLTRAEFENLHSHGIDIVTVWETYANRALSGHAAGAVDAKDAEEQARWIGIPDGRPIFFAIDFDETPSEAEAVRQYFGGVNSVLGRDRTGAYGGYWSVKRLFDAGLIKYGWQTYAWSGGNWDHRAQLQQYSNGHYVSGVGVDFDRAVAEDFGQWFYRAPKPDPRPRNTGHSKFEGAVNLENGEPSITYVHVPGLEYHREETFQFEVGLKVAPGAHAEYTIRKK
jgi:hypothetical protein